jgi:hypothetical protein
MNPEFFTDEFKNFKYLKSNPMFVRQYKGRAEQINSIQPWSTPNDPNFVWPFRVEFLEQLIDLRDDTIYLVYPGPLDKFGAYSAHPGHESSAFHEIINPIIYEGNILQPGLGEIISYEDIPSVEDITGAGWCLCSEEYFNNSSVELARGPVFKLDRTFLFLAVEYSAIFYDKETAEKYRDCLTEFLRKTTDTVSALARLF